MRPPLAAGLAGGRRRPARPCWCCWARSSTRCWWSRCSTPSPRCPTARCAPRSCAWPTRRACTVDDVLVADASRRTTTLNAYVSGFGGTRRVVVYDTLVDDLPEDQALSVVAHELAHAEHDDVVTGSVLGARRARWSASGCSALVVGAVGRRTGVGDGRPGGRAAGAGAAGASGTLRGEPAGERRQPGDRDPCRRRRAARRPTTRRPSSPCSASWRCGRWPTRRPPAWSQLWFGSHPTTLERIAIARQLGRQGDLRPAGRLDTP